VERVAAAAEKKFGAASVLVNNAGVTGPFGPVWVMDPDEWWNAQEVIVRGTLLFMREVMPGMVERRKGSVINIASLGGQWFTPLVSCYGIGKMSQIRLSELAAAEAKPHGVCVYVIEPGTVITEMAESTMARADAQRWMPQMVEYFRELKRTSDPAKGLARCAEMCVQLASGKYAALAGRFLIPPDDFDKLALEPAPPPGSSVLPREAPRTT
jgi:NAD(P)-dependent dehydrogenase (short-subunit alcohol dehydrogenase family)